jgi:hypothetical protein
VQDELGMGREQNRHAAEATHQVADRIEGWH